MTDTTDPAEGQSLLAYLRAYAAGEFEREQMIADVVTWPIHPTEPPDNDPQDYVPDLDENSATVLSAAVTIFGWLTEQDYQEIARRRNARPPDLRHGGAS